jgi:xanthine dehydrogenase accessory factor
LRVVGESPIAIALADLAKRLGYAVELGPAEASEPSPDDAAVVVASHGHDEERVLTAALRSRVPYVALVASQIRGDAVRQSLDLPEELLAELHTPAGLEIGAETHEEIALAILAEIVALRRLGTAEAYASAPPEPAAAPASAPTEAAIDPVCGMEVAVSVASIQLERDGERYYFCSEGCRDSFSAEGVPGGAAR